MSTALSSFPLISVNVTVTLATQPAWLFHTLPPLSVHLLQNESSDALVQGLIYTKCLSTGEGPCACAEARGKCPFTVAFTVLHSTTLMMEAPCDLPLGSMLMRQILHSSENPAGSQESCSHGPVGEANSQRVEMLS